MTTPTERRRALRWLPGTLLDIQADAGTPAELKLEVEALLAKWPSQGDVLGCFTDVPDELLGRVLDAISSATALLELARQCRSLKPETARAIQATFRHFPQEWEMPAGRERSLPPRAWIDLYLLRDVDHADLAREIESIRSEGSG